MSRSNKSKVLLVRNPSVPIKCRGVVGQTVVEPKRVHFEESAGSEQVCDMTSLRNPEFATALRLATDADRIRSAKWCLRTKSPDPVAGKSLDFMPDEKLYQDLIALNMPETRSIKDSKTLISAKCNLKKDPEPDYQNLLNYEIPQPLLFSSCTWPPVKKASNKTACFDGKSLFKKFQIWCTRPPSNSTH